MCPVSVSLGWSNIAPSQDIQACDVHGRGLMYTGSGTISKLQRIIGTPSSNDINWEQNRQQNAGKRYEYDEEGLQVSQKEVGIETAFVDDLAISESKYGEEPAPWTSRRWFGSFSFGD